VPTTSEAGIKGADSPLYMSPDEFARFVREEMDTYARVIKLAGIKPQ